MFAKHPQAASSTLLLAAVCILPIGGYAGSMFSDWNADNQSYIASREWEAQDKSYYPNFTYNPLLSERGRHMMDPYLLPLNHPAKGAMDRIFAKPGVIRNYKTVKAAGFKILHKQKKSFICVLKHPLLKGYLIKTYLDSEKRVPRDMPGWKRLTMRCIVAAKIKSIIAKHNIVSFIVADKWVYPLPTNESWSEDNQPIVLLVRDMKIYDPHASAKAWRKQANHQTIRELYEIFKRGYGSAFLVGNLPYTHSGRFAFIDTEFGKRKLPMIRLSRYFTPKLRRYWFSLLHLRRDRLTTHYEVPTLVH